MSTAVILYGAFRQSRIALSCWANSPYVNDIHCITWNQTQQGQCVVSYSANAEIASVFANPKIKLSSFTMLDDRAYLHSVHWDSSNLRRLYKHWSMMLELLRSRGYSKVIITRNDLFVDFSSEFSDNDLHVNDKEIILEHWDIEKGYTGDWFYVMRWETFERFVAELMHVCNTAPQSDPHAAIFNIVQKLGLSVKSPQNLRTVIVRPPSRDLKIENMESWKIYDRLSHDFGVWEYYVRGTSYDQPHQFTPT